MDIHHLKLNFCEQMGQLAPHLRRYEPRYPAAAHSVQQYKPLIDQGMVDKGLVHDLNKHFSYLSACAPRSVT